MPKPINHVYSKKMLPSNASRETRLKPMPRKITKERVMLIANNCDVDYGQAKNALEIFDGDISKAEKFLSAIIELIYEEDEDVDQDL